MGSKSGGGGLLHPQLSGGSLWGLRTRFNLLIVTFTVLGAIVFAASLFKSTNNGPSSPPPLPQHEVDALPAADTEPRVAAAVEVDDDDDVTTVTQVTQPAGPEVAAAVETVDPAPPPLVPAGLHVAAPEPATAPEPSTAPEPNECDVSDGGWVLDEAARPLYSGLNCSYLHEEIACEKWGRKDKRHQQWRWQPHHCDLPRFNATRFLEKLKGKRMVFVGDSLNRNQWISLICLLESKHPQPPQKATYMGSLVSYKSHEYNVSIEFYWSPMLVESNCDDPIIHRISDREIRADAGAMDKHAKEWEGGDIIVFNSYLWWQKQGIKARVRYGSFEDNLEVSEMELIDGFRVALKAWSLWLELNLKAAGKQIYFMSYSPTHMFGWAWGAMGGQGCYNESEPIVDIASYISRGKDEWMTKAEAKEVERLRSKGLNARLLDITRMSEYRKDGHPSVFRKFWLNLTDENIANPSSYADCTHWCLPGVPDSWNELLYYYILQS